MKLRRTSFTRIRGLGARYWKRETDWDKYDCWARARARDHDRLAFVFIISACSPSIVKINFSDSEKLWARKGVSDVFEASIRENDSSSMVLSRRIWMNACDASRWKERAVIVARIACGSINITWKKDYFKSSWRCDARHEVHAAYAIIYLCILRRVCRVRLHVLYRHARVRARASELLKRVLVAGYVTG